MKNAILALIAIFATVVAQAATITVTSTPLTSASIKIASGEVRQAFSLDLVADETTSMSKIQFSLWINGSGMGNVIQTVILMDQDDNVVDEFENVVNEFGDGLGSVFWLKTPKTLVAEQHYVYRVVVVAGYSSYGQITEAGGIGFCWIETPANIKTNGNALAYIELTSPDSYWPNSIQVKRDMIVLDGKLLKGALSAYRLDSWNESQTLESPMFEVVGSGNLSQVGLLYLTDVFGKKLCKPQAPILISEGRAVYRFNTKLNIPIGGMTVLVKGSPSRYRGQIVVSALINQMFPVGQMSGYQTRAWGSGSWSTVGATIVK